VLVTVDPSFSDPERFTTELRGWQDGAYLLFDWPADPTEAAVPRSHHAVTVQFLADGNACGFQATVLSAGSTSSPQFRISWPDHVEQLSLRKDERISVNAPCVVQAASGDSVEGRLVDISAGGCKVTVASDEGLVSDVMVDFSLEGGLTCSGLPAMVRSVTKGPLGIVLGCQFQGLPDITRYDIQFYVATTVERMRDTTGSGQRVLVIDNDVARLNQLRDALSISDIHIASATNVVDGFYRLRLRPPDMLILNSALEGLDTESVCRLVISTRGFENLQIAVYGVENASESERLRAAGAAHAVADTYAVVEVVDTMAPRPDENAEEEAATG
jgi:CheY-like chemotaxis protein